MAAIIAPSFPAEFHDVADHRKIVGMIRSLGSSDVSEVSFGADLVAHRAIMTCQRNACKELYLVRLPCHCYFHKIYHPEAHLTTLSLLSLRWWQ